LQQFLPHNDKTKGMTLIGQEQPKFFIKRQNVLISIILDCDLSKIIRWPTGWGTLM